MGKEDAKETMVKMKRTDIPQVRKMLVAKQKGICPICGKDLTRTKAVNVVIDHDHTTGVVRAALHRGCNKVEGSVLSTITRWGKASGMAAVMATLKRLLAFWELHSTPQTEWIYYNHKTAAEKRAALNKRRRKQYAAKRKNS
jgi:hypothetical protein